MHCYTSITNNYIPKVRILAKTLKQHNPDWKLHVVLSEPLHPSIEPGEEPFDSIVSVDDLGLENTKGWIFRHRVTEICTAVKGYAALYLIEKHDLDSIIYFDPDIAVFNDLTPLEELLKKHPILLAPHQSKPETTPQAIKDNEVGSLRWGVFNLGFMAARADGQGLEFLRWWAERLNEYCFDDIPYGLFTDQRWCDLAPVFFDKLHILRDPEYDVATWNLTQRDLSMSSDGTLLVDGRPLRFYHYSGYDSQAGITVVQYLFPNQRHVIYDMWEWYLFMLAQNGQDEIGNVEWFYSRFSDGSKVENDMRTLYRGRKDLQAAFPNPFVSDPVDKSFVHWWRANMQVEQVVEQKLEIARSTLAAGKGPGLSAFEPGSLLARVLAPKGSKRERLLAVSKTKHDAKDASTPTPDGTGTNGPQSLDGRNPAESTMAPSKESVPSLRSYRQRANGQLSQGARDPNYQPQQPDLAVSPPVKLMAFYRSAPETRWGSLMGAQSQFEGHVPLVPENLDFTARQPDDVLRSQIELARRHGVYGFVVEVEANEIDRPGAHSLLASDELEFPFCLDVEIRQGNDVDRVIDAGEPLIESKNYVRIDDRPVVVVDSTSLETNQLVEQWKRRREANGKPAPYFVGSQSIGLGRNVETEGATEIFDALIRIFPWERPPDQACLHSSASSRLTLLNRGFHGNVLSYPAIVAGVIANEPKVDKPVFEAAAPGFDNLAVEDSGGLAFAFASPALYKQWLQRICKRALSDELNKEKLVFVHDWNGWATGSALEPSYRFGYGFLSATAAALQFAARLAAGVIVPSEPPQLEDPKHENKLEGLPRKPIFVYQMGKVGSMAIVVGLQKMNLPDPIIHSHSLNNLDKLAKRVCEANPNPDEALFEVHRGMAVRRWMLQADENTVWNVITMVRDPVGRNISAFFENIAALVPNIRARYEAEDFTVEELHELFLHMHHHDLVFGWFHWELRNLFGLDMLKEPFDPHAGYQIYEKGNTRLLLIRTEDISRKGPAAIQEFLGLPEFVVPQSINTAEGKYYADIIKIFKTKPLPKWYLDRMYNSEFTRHFYLPEEIERFRLKWSAPNPNS